MLLDFSTSNIVLWEQLVQLKKKLHNFSHADLIELFFERDRFEQKSLNFIRHIIIDAIDGGYYSFDQEVYQINLRDNAILANYLLIAGKVFCHGELTYYAIKLLENIQKNLLDKQSGFFIENIIFNAKELPFKINGNVINSLLDENELCLLCALIDQKIIKNNSSYIIHYHIDLRLAADKSGLFYKQAQTLQASFIKKLKVAQTSFYLSYSEQKNNNNELIINIKSNVYFLQSLTQAILWHNKKEFSSTASQLCQLLVNFIHSKTINNSAITDLIDACYAIVEFNQIHFDQQQMQLVANKIIDLVTLYQFKITTKVFNYLFVLAKVFSHLNLIKQPQQTYFDELLFKNNLLKPNVNIIILKNSVKTLQEKQQQLSKYDMQLMLFTID